MVYHVDFAIRERQVGTFDLPCEDNAGTRASFTAVTDRFAQLVQKCSLTGDEYQPIAEWLHQTVDTPARSRNAQRALFNMLELHQLTSSIRLSMQPVNIVVLLQNVCTTHSHHAAQKGLCLGLVIEPVDGVIQADQLLLHRAISHIVDNAIHFTLPGGVVEIHLMQMEQLMRIEFADTGIGIEPYAIPHVFNRFFRTTRARQYGTAGNGLGLTISQTIINAHGGSIDIESMPDQGSIFTISLPLVSWQTRTGSC